METTPPKGRNGAAKKLRMTDTPKIPIVEMHQPNLPKAIQLQARTLNHYIVGLLQELRTGPPTEERVEQIYDELWNQIEMIEDTARLAEKQWSDELAPAYRSLITQEREAADASTE